LNAHHFRQAVERRQLEQRDERITQSMGVDMPRRWGGAPKGSRGGRCECGRVSLLGRDVCATCDAIEQGTAASSGKVTQVGVRAWVRTRPGSVTVADVVARFDCAGNMAAQVLSRLVLKGVVRRVSRGIYEVVQ
jgi:hypothetical protein